MTGGGPCQFPPILRPMHSTACPKYSCLISFGRTFSSKVLLLYLGFENPKIMPVPTNLPAHARHSLPNIHRILHSSVRLGGSISGWILDIYLVLHDVRTLFGNRFCSHTSSSPCTAQPAQCTLYYSLLYIIQ